ncbi:MAG: FkbM family methyltransferase [Verrucomicrobia bacterium]|nr:FkbM family methyltransferase [Verrucomicrobiota bacterium]
MKILRFIGILQVLISSLCGVDISCQGIIPSYIPYEIGAMLLFTPYNPNVLIAGEDTANVAAHFAQATKCSTVFCCTPDQKDFENLEKYQQSFPNIHPYFGMFHTKDMQACTYFATKPHEKPYQSFFRFSGSLLPPTDFSLPFLFGEERLIPTFSLHRFCKKQDISKIHVFHLNCGGNELQLLQNNLDLTQNAIVICVKTYHQPFRKNLPSFEKLHQFMSNCDFVLFSQHIYDGIIGDALYVKRKYFRAVFQSKEL